MTFAPVFITIDERMKLGLCSPLLLGEQPQRGRWYHEIPGTDIMENVYDPRLWRKDGYQLRPTGGAGGYFPPGATLPRPTGRCREMIEREVSDDPRNWKLVEITKHGSGRFVWIGPKQVSRFAGSEMYVPAERMHEMRGAPLGELPSMTVGVGIGALLVAGGAWWWWKSRRRRR